ncbi:MAG: hypothetical protein K9K66_04375 [Desulfarculaceae bacterium]|nr:hypothetical protein [Desulfarculaceae bacterium]MCF8100875.1 hypothetical protein [Desulfarculaceae bacterium]
MMGTTHNFGYGTCGGEIADWLHLSPDAMEETGLEPGDRVAWFWDEERRLVGIKKSTGPDTYTVSCYGCHGGGRINAPILTAVEAPGDRKPRDIAYDQEAGFYTFSIDRVEVA